MKITIIAHSDYSRNKKNNTWDDGARCVMFKSCKECELYPIVGNNCIEFRKPIINATNTRTLPYTVDTDDFPELFI